jgi:hypothetical protein
MAKQKRPRSALPSQSATVTIKRISATLALMADGIDELTEVGELDLHHDAALGFARVVRSCAEDLQKLTPSMAAKKVPAKTPRRDRK